MEVNSKLGPESGQERLSQDTRFHNNIQKFLSQNSPRILIESESNGQYWRYLPKTAGMFLFGNE
jgi:hypothetical protein